jgi:hypothetical protein
MNKTALLFNFFDGFGVSGIPRITTASEASQEVVKFLLHAPDDPPPVAGYSVPASSSGPCGGLFGPSKFVWSLWRVIRSQQVRLVPVAGYSVPASSSGPCDGIVWSLWRVIRSLCAVGGIVWPL